MSKHKKRSIIMKVVLAIVVAVLLLELALVVFLEKKQDNHPANSETAAPTTEFKEATEATEELPEPSETEQPATESTASPTLPATTVEIVECVDGRIQTPYFALYYPETLADLLVVAKTEDDPFTLEFYAMLEDRPEQRIFDIRLSETIEGNMGIVEAEDARVYVDLTFYQFSPDASWTKDEINTILAMQEAANEMINSLNREENSSSQENKPAVEETAPVSSVVNMLTIQTPYGALHYPVRWKDYLVTEHIENEETGIYSVEFYGKVANQEKCLLFTILFGGDEGDQLGVILQDNGDFITVNILVAELELDGWSESDMQILFTMQEAMNELIEQLDLE